MKNIFAYIFLGGFILGIASASFLRISNSYFYLVLVVCVSVMCVFLLQKNARNNFLYFFIFLLSFSVGALRFNYSYNSISSGWAESVLDRKIVVSGVVVREPDTRDTQTKLTVKISNEKFGKKSFLILTTVPMYPVYEYGDHIELTGKISLPKNRVSDTGKNFDYISYLRKEGVGYEMYLPDTKLLRKNAGSFVVHKMLELKYFFISKINTVFPEPQSSLLSGLLLGGKSSLGSGIQDDFRRAGIVHIVVLSGYNITIVAEAVMKIFSFAPRMIGFGMGSIGIVLFSIMTGAGATVVRASVMALLAVLARATGRVYDMTVALFFAGFVMLLNNPHILIFDTSFQLSFLATLGLIVFCPKIEGKVKKFLPEMYGLRSIVVSTLATQLFVLPLLLYNTGLFSVVSFVANIFVLPLVPLTMGLGFMSILVGIISTTVAVLVGYPVFFLLSYILKTAHIFSSFQWAALSITFPFWLMSGVYLLYLFIFLRKIVLRLQPSLYLRRMLRYISFFRQEQNLE